MAADQGLPAAMFYTGICYLQGMGVSANLSEGKKWIKKASTQTTDPEVKKAASDVLKQLP
jgi:TPR repeat protein